MWYLASVMRDSTLPYATISLQLTEWCCSGEPGGMTLGMPINNWHDSAISNSAANGF